MMLVCALAFPAAAQMPVQRRIPGQRPLSGAAVLGTLRDQQGRIVPGASVKLRNLANNRAYIATSNGEGIFRLRDLPAGTYELVVTTAGYEPVPPSELQLASSEVRTLTLTL